MRSSPSARAAFLLLYGALLAWQIDRWCFTRHGIVSTWAARHDGRTISAGAPGGVSQTFTMGADGIDGVWLQPVVAGPAPHGELLVDLLEVQGGRRQRLLRVAVPATAVSTGVALHVPFRAIRASRGITYQLDVRHIRIGAGPAIDLAVTRDDIVHSGRLLVDGREQWGDLVFETTSRRATLPYWIHEVLGPWPAWVRAWPTIALTLLIFNVVLALACARAVGMLGDDAHSPVAVAPTPTETRGSSHARVLQASQMIVAIIAITGVALAARPTGRYRSLDLIEALPDARIETTWPSVHAAISAQPVVIFGRIHRAIVALPTSVIRWEIDVPRGAVLRFGAAMRPDMWSRESDGIQMRVRLEHAGVTTQLADYTLVPMLVEMHKQLHQSESVLAPWAGERVTLVFESTPERFGNAVNDVPVWVAPRIEWPRHLAAGEARVVPP